MNLRRILQAHVFLFLYFTSDSLIDLALRSLLWGVVLLIVFRETILPKLGELSTRLGELQQRALIRLNSYLSDFSIARVIKTLLLLKVLLFFTWLLPQWLIILVLTESWAFKEQIKPLRQQLKQQVKGGVAAGQEFFSKLISQIPRYNRITL